MISLPGCMPYTAALDFQTVASITQEVLPGAGPLALQSGGQGLPALRERLVKIVRAEGVPAHPTTWLSRMEAEALDLVAKLSCDPGDVVLAEGPSYVGAIGAFSAHQSQLLHAPMDAE